MADEIFYWSKMTAPALLLFGIFANLFNLRDAEKWAVKHFAFALFGLAASMTVSLSMAETLAAYRIYFVILAIYFLLNWRESGLNIAIAGSLLNMFVIILNDGHMPMALTPLDSEDGFYRFIDGNTVLPILSDIIRIGNYRASIGDILLRIGPPVFLISQLKKLAYEKK